MSMLLNKTIWKCSTRSFQNSHWRH
jgi:hypothetical protein